MDRHALSLRGVAAEYALSTAVVADAIRRGELPAARLGAQRLTILRSDVERWLAAHRVRVDASDVDVVERRLEREERSAAG